ncbi:hypothetical protein Droror1_Dr00013666 [Drosera rotundifolia]
MPAFSIQGVILVLSYLVHHPIAVTSDNGSFHLVENNACRNAMCTDKSSKCQAFRFTNFPARYPQQPPPSPTIRATKLSASIRKLLVGYHQQCPLGSLLHPTVPPATAATGASPSLGRIPSDISKLLSNITEVLLENNQFAGCLPYQLGLLKQLTLLDISKNQLTGPLAFSFGCLENAEVLNFAENLLYGIVPDLVCELRNLANLKLSRNYFQGLGQACWNLIKSGVLDARNNCIPGLPSQRSVVQCATFFASPRICPYMDTYTIIPCKLPRLV